MHGSRQETRCVRSSSVDCEQDTDTKSIFAIDNQQAKVDEAGDDYTLCWCCCCSGDKRKSRMMCLLMMMMMRQRQRHILCLLCELTERMIESNGQTWAWWADVSIVWALKMCPEKEEEKEDAEIVLRSIQLSITTTRCVPIMQRASQWKRKSASRWWVVRFLFPLRYANECRLIDIWNAFCPKKRKRRSARAAAATATTAVVYFDN